VEFRRCLTLYLLWVACCHDGLDLQLLCKIETRTQQPVAQAEFTTGMPRTTSSLSGIRSIHVDLQAHLCLRSIHLSIYQHRAYLPSSSSSQATPRPCPCCSQQVGHLADHAPVVVGCGPPPHVPPIALGRRRKKTVLTVMSSGEVNIVPLIGTQQPLHYHAASVPGRQQWCAGEEGPNLLTCSCASSGNAGRADHSD
jgi:hypothetical protein